MLRGGGHLIVSGTIFFRQVTALILVITVFLFMLGATANGACADFASSRPAITCLGDEPSPIRQEHDDHQPDELHHRPCCKCPCHGLKIFAHPTRIGLLSQNFVSTWSSPRDDKAIKSPVFTIFQPPKLPV